MSLESSKTSLELELNAGAGEGEGGSNPHFSKYLNLVKFPH